MRRIIGKETLCTSNPETTKGPCYIKHVFKIESGEYWCDGYGKARSKSANISITAGSVILVIPALPVPEGENVTLTCMNKTTPAAVANFNKGSALKGGSMTIYNVSKSDEGFYKCSIPGVGESAESWLAVRDQPSNVVIIMWTSILLAFLLLVLGLFVCFKHKALICATWKSLRSRYHTGDMEPVSAGTHEDDPEMGRDAG
ncbi:uncharacterized protein LOC121504360 [Cheilinus undulatus]|uniref:uncharacterized protein LOC121504360 n=1 Tax=Cheilinus undulatus TaxID=241271 RepID=UPI001BD6CDE0|nr:uncharacterized protein LOC121504360 [Cheilinus undulatus]